MANTYLTRTQGTPTNNKIFTVSCWFKASQVASEMKLIYSDDNSTNNYTYIHFSDDSGRIRFQNRNGGSNNTELIFQNHIRDFSGWYHLVMAVDSTQSTASNRVKFYLNGTQYTDLDSGQNTYPPLNQSFTLNSGGYGVDIGSSNTSNYFQGIMSHFHFCDGTQLAPTVFGSTDNTTGQWKINTSPSFTLGNNGFTILKDGNTITDQSSNSNNFSLGGGTLTKTEDCPSNVFSTLNPLIKASNQPTFTNANTTVISPSGTNARYGGTLGMTSGKYYYEVKLLGSVTNGGFSAGMLNIDSFNFNSTSGISSSSNYIGAVVNNNNLYIQHGGASNDFTPTVALGSIIGHAIDMDNGYYYVHVNGVYLNSGNPTSGATGTGNINRTGNLNYNFSNLTMAFGGSSQNADYGSFNFGNGTFGTTAVSSAGTNASSNGVFEYDVPTGYTALSTKGLNL